MLQVNSPEVFLEQNCLKSYTKGIHEDNCYMTLTKYFVYINKPSLLTPWGGRKISWNLIQQLISLLWFVTTTVYVSCWPTLCSWTLFRSSLFWPAFMQVFLESFTLTSYYLLTLHLVISVQVQHLQKSWYEHIFLP